MVFLTEIEVGKKARITDLSNLNQLMQRRLLDIGVVEGAVITLKRKLPFRGPCIIEVCEQCIGLRLLETSKIQVSLEET